MFVAVALAGALGGVCGVVATYPLDTLRARLAVHPKAGMHFFFSCQHYHKSLGLQFEKLTKRLNTTYLYLFTNIFCLDS